MRNSSALSLCIIFGSLLASLSGMSADQSQPHAADALRQKTANLRKAAVHRVIAAVRPALVRVRVVSVSYRWGREAKSESFGSGVIISPDGYIVTNHHVAADAKHITCTLDDREVMDAEVIGTDALTDLSVLKLQPATPRVFAFAPFGDSGQVQVGDDVFAMGSPLAFSQSVTMGVVSNTALVMPDSLPEDRLLLDGEEVSSVVSWIAHDAAIFPGNSGGPLVNLAGEIIGINEMSMGLSGAIPGNLVRDVARRIIDEGRVTRSWIGLSVQPLLKSMPGRGVLVTGTVKDSPAERAGFRRGDILVAIGDHPVDVRFREELPGFNQRLMSQVIGQPVTMTVRRDGAELALSVIPEERRDVKSATEELPSWGVCVSRLTPFRAREMQRDSTAGLLVESVRTGSPADCARPGLCGADILLEVGGTPVNSPGELRQVTETILGAADAPVPVLVAFERAGEQMLTVVTLGDIDARDTGREIRKAWLPAATQVFTRELAAALGLSGVKGVRVTRLYPHAALEDVDLRVGDIITAVDDLPIEACQLADAECLPAMIRQYRVGSTVELTVLRNRESHRIAIMLPAAPKLVRELDRYRNDAYEFTARDLAFVDRVCRELAEDAPGVVIESVSEGGWASLGRLHAGDLLVGVAGHPVADVAALRTVMKRVAEKRPRMVVFEIRRGIRTLFLELEASWT